MKFSGFAPRLVVVAACLAAAAQCRAQVAGSDNFVQRQVLTAAGGSGSNAAATAETTFEPAHAGFNAAKSLWWRYQQQTSGLVELSTAGSLRADGTTPMQTRLAVYTVSGTLPAAFTAVAANVYTPAAGGASPSVVRFIAQGGVQYAIAVDGASLDATNAVYDSGTIQLSLATLPAAGAPPSNDNFNSRITLPAAGTAGSTTYASTEALEPDPTTFQATSASAGRSLWYSWVPPAAGSYTVSVSSAAGSGVVHQIGVYTGTSLAAVASPPASVCRGSHPAISRTEVNVQQTNATFNATAGTPYVIQVVTQSYSCQPGDFTLKAAATTRPANDDWAAATVLGPALPARSVSTLTGASRQSGEPNHVDTTTPAAGTAFVLPTSLWWKWTANLSGTCTVDTRGSYGDTLLSVYTGGTLATMVQPPGVNATLADDISYDSVVLASVASFNASPGVTYYFCVSGYTAGEKIVLHLAQGTPRTPYAAWLLDYPALTSTAAGRYADPDGDGLTNLVELGLGTDPTAPSRPDYSSTTSPLQFNVTGDLGSMVATFNTQDFIGLGAGTSLTGAFQTSTDLTDWSLVTDTDGGIEFPVIPGEPAYFRVKINDVNP